MANIKTICRIAVSSKHPTSTGLTSSKLYEQSAAAFEKNGFKVIPGMCRSDYFATKQNIRSLKKSQIRDNCDASLLVIVNGYSHRWYKKGSEIHTIPGAKVGNKFQLQTKVYEKEATDYGYVFVKVLMRLNVQGQNTLEEKSKSGKDRLPFKELDRERWEVSDLAERHINETLQGWAGEISMYSQK